MFIPSVQARFLNARSIGSANNTYRLRFKMMRNRDKREVMLLNSKYVSHCRHLEKPDRH